MILCLDIGNSHVFGGLLEGDTTLFTFRKTSGKTATSDEIGLFLRGVLRENGHDPAAIDAIALCSVVPQLAYSIDAACRKYFGIEPFVLRAGVRTGLKILYRNPREVGADRIANAIGAIDRHPGADLLVVDLGTATTVDAIRAGRDYVGGAIMPGLRLSMQALDHGTSKLRSVEIVRPERYLGQTTAASIQSGLFHGHLGALRHILSGIAKERFSGEKPTVVATGGFAHLFAEAEVFDEIVPELVLHGLQRAQQLNSGSPDRRRSA